MNLDDDDGVERRHSFRRNVAKRKQELRGVTFGPWFWMMMMGLKDATAFGEMLLRESKSSEDWPLDPDFGWWWWGWKTPQLSEKCC